MLGTMHVLQTGYSNISSNKSILIRAESEINANQWFRDKTFFLLSRGFWQSTDYSCEAAMEVQTGGKCQPTPAEFSLFGSI